MIDSVSRSAQPATITLGERVSGLLDAWRPKA
jgi:hypothetical protein